MRRLHSRSARPRAVKLRTQRRCDRIGPAHRRHPKSSQRPSNRVCGRPPTRCARMALRDACAGASTNGLPPNSPPGKGSMRAEQGDPERSVTSRKRIDEAGHDLRGFGRCTNAPTLSGSGIPVLTSAVKFRPVRVRAGPARDVAILSTSHRRATKSRCVLAPTDLDRRPAARHRQQGGRPPTRPRVRVDQAAGGVPADLRSRSVPTPWPLSRSRWSRV